MIEKFRRKRLIRLITCFIVIVIVIGFLSNENVLNKQTNYVIDTNLIFNALQQAKTREEDLKNKYQVSAIIVHWNRLSQVQKLVQYYLNSQLFKEIIVWNNNPQIVLGHNHVLINISSSIPIFIINSKYNFKDEAKYHACAEAQTLVCFYADDDWDASHYMKSLIASFRSDPNILHTATNEITYYNNLLWTFTDRQTDLHTGFSWIDTGSVFLRDCALRHLQLLKIHLKTHQELLAYSDIFFSIWLNDMPSQMVVNLHSLAINMNAHDKPFSFDGISTDLHHTSSILAIRTLEYHLRLNDSTKTISFPRQQIRRFPYYVKSPNVNDDFIFYSNILPIDVEHIPFDITLDADRATYRNIPHGSNFTHFVSHSTLKAVDNNEKTCWSPVGIVNKGDFFAIDFLHIQNNIAFVIIIGHSQELHRSLAMRISFDGTWWISHQSIKGTLINLNALPPSKLYKLTVDSSQFALELQSFRYIAFNATYAFTESFQVCDIRIIKNRK